MVGRTTVVIAHRLSTVRDAELIYVLQNGAVIEEGNHAQLLASGGHYANLLRQGEVLSEPGKPEPVAG
jgi:ABC-type multidrug transport system fused ATPase/permease subunit